MPRVNSNNDATSCLFLELSEHSDDNSQYHYIIMKYNIIS